MTDTDEKAWNQYLDQAKQAEAEPEKPQAVADQPEAEAPEAEPEEKVKEEKVVPLAALHEARAKNKEVQAKLREYEAWKNQAEARLQALIQAQQQKQEPAIPKYEENPAEYLRLNLEKTAEANRKIQEQLEQGSRAQAQAAQLAALEQWGSAQAAQYREENKDFDEAYRHVRGHRVAEYRAMGMNAAQAEAAMLNDERQFLAHAYQTGQNPAELVHNMAKQTGWKSQPVSEEQKIEKMAEGAKASKSMKGSSAPKVSLEALASLDEEEFAAAMKSGAWEKLMRSAR